MKEYIDKNRSRFQDRYTLIIMACAAAAPEFVVCMAKRHFDSLAEEYNKVMDVVELQYRDKETSRQIIQIMLNDAAKAPE